MKKEEWADKLEDRKRISLHATIAVRGNIVREIVAEVDSSSIEFDVGKYVQAITDAIWYWLKKISDDTGSKVTFNKTDYGVGGE